MNILRFEANTPVQVTLKYDGGRDVAGRYGPQVLYTLADGRLMYLEPKAARRIDELKITAGEPFSICKSEVRTGQKRKVEWDVKRLEPTARLELVPHGSGELGHATQSSGRSADAALDRQQREPDMNGSAATTLETELRASIPGLAKLEHALKTAIAAAAGAEQFGHEIGYEVHFAPVDIRAIAIEILMNGSKDTLGRMGNHEQGD
jgi:hypothetical protein